ncbi:cytochrome c biogenesis protein CcsA [Glaciecola sp. 1036]|uniref:cytochrome c biogenesis protein CcsA n=1 Tax=Alteromonadaceae TaxID=72275 RepID=UPI003CFD7B16
MNSFDTFRLNTLGVPLALVSTGLMLAIIAAYQIFYVVPLDYQMGVYVRWLFPHVAAAFSAGILFFILAFISFKKFGSANTLLLLFFRAMAACIVFLTLMTLLTGAIWAVPVWGDFWVWDARSGFTVLFLVVCFGIYVGTTKVLNNPKLYFIYLLLVAVAAIVLFLSHQSPEWWNTMHQESRLSNFKFDGYAPEYLKTIAFSLGAVLFISVGYILSSVRRRI